MIVRNSLLIFWKYFVSFKVAWKDAIFHPNKIFITLLLSIVRVGILISLYAYAFKYVGGSLNGLDVGVVAVSISFYFIMFVFGIRYIYKDINQDVYSGNIELYLNKPINYILYKFFQRVGYGILVTFFSFVTAMILIHFFIGLPQNLFSIEVLVSGLFLFFLGSILVGIVYSLIGIVAFWIENSDPVFWIVDKTAMILGGSYVPVALFPEFLQNLSLYSPFGAMLFVTRIPYPNFRDEYFLLLFIQICWIIILGFALKILFDRAKKKLNVNGG